MKSKRGQRVEKDLLGHKSTARMVKLNTDAHAF